MKTFNEFINEGVSDYLQPKSDEDVWNNIKNLHPNQMLVDSINANYIKGVKYAIEKGALIFKSYIRECMSDVNYIDIVNILVDNVKSFEDNKTTDKYGNDLLMLSILSYYSNKQYNGYIDISKKLLDKGYSVTNKNRLGNTSLIMSAHYGAIDLIDPILNHGANINEVNKYGETALVYAVISDYSDIVDMLLNRGADPLIVDENGNNAITKYNNIKNSRPSIYEVFKKHKLIESVNDYLQPKSEEEIKKSRSETIKNIKDIIRANGDKIYNLHILTDDINIGKDIHKIIELRVHDVVVDVISLFNPNDKYRLPYDELDNKVLSKIISILKSGIEDKLLKSPDINESITDILKGPSRDEINKRLRNLSTNDKIELIIKKKISYSMLDRDENGRCIYNGDLDVAGYEIYNLPINLTVTGELFCEDNFIRNLPSGLIVNNITCTGNEISELPPDIIVKNDIDCSEQYNKNGDYSPYKVKIPESAKIGGRIFNEPHKNAKSINESYSKNTLPSDALRMDQIQEYLDELRNDSNYNEEEVEYDSLLDTYDGYPWQTYIENLGNGEFYYWEGWTKECWIGLYGKKEYKGLTKEKALQKFINERVPQLADEFNLTIIDSKYFWHQTWTDGVDDGYIMRIHFKINDNLNERIRDYLEPKSKEEIYKSFGNKNMSKEDIIRHIIVNQLPFFLLPRNEDGVCVYDRTLTISIETIRKLPDNLTIKGSLYCRDNKLSKLPKKLTVYEDLNVAYNNLSVLPNDLRVYGNLLCYGNKVKKLELPEGAIVRGSIIN